jgi:hypothetical protein
MAHVSVTDVCITEHREEHSAIGIRAIEHDVMFTSHVQSLPRPVHHDFSLREAWRIKVRKGQTRRIILNDVWSYEVERKSVYTICKRSSSNLRCNAQILLWCHAMWSVPVCSRCSKLSVLVPPTSPRRFHALCNTSTSAFVAIRLHLIQCASGRYATSRDASWS